MAKSSRPQLRTMNNKVRRQSKADLELEALMAKFDLEDRIVSMLTKVPPDIANLVAMRVARYARRRWEIARQQMIRDGDQREVYDSASSDDAWLAAASRTIDDGEVQ